MLKSKYLCFYCSSIIEDFTSKGSRYIKCPICGNEILKYHIRDHRIWIDNDRREFYFTSKIPYGSLYPILEQYNSYTFLLSSYRPFKDIHLWDIEKFRLFTHFKITLTRIIANLKSISIEILDIGKYNYDILSILGYWSKRSLVYYVDVFLPNDRDRRILIGSELKNDREMILNRVSYMIASYLLIL